MSPTRVCSFSPAGSSLEFFDLAWSVLRQPFRSLGRGFGGQLWRPLIMFMGFIERIARAALRGQIGCLCTTFVLRLLKLTLSIHDYLLSAQARPITPPASFKAAIASQVSRAWLLASATSECPPPRLGFYTRNLPRLGVGWGWGHAIYPLDDLFNAGRRERGGNWWPQWLDFLCRGGWSMRPAGFDPFPPFPPRASRLIVPLAWCLSSLSASYLPPPPFPPRASQSPNQSAGSPSTPPCTTIVVRTCFEAACTRYRYPGHPFLSHIFYYFQTAAAIKAGIDKGNASMLGARTLPPLSHVPPSCERPRPGSAECDPCSEDLCLAGNMVTCVFFLGTILVISSVWARRNPPERLGPFSSVRGCEKAAANWPSPAILMPSRTPRLRSHFLCHAGHSERVQCRADGHETLQPCGPWQGPWGGLLFSPCTGDLLLLS